MIVDPNFCMNSYLMYRTIVDKNYVFSKRIPTWYADNTQERVPVANACELSEALKYGIEQAFSQGPAALMLSGGMDSAILASYMPKGSRAYTLHCIAESAIDERAEAADYALMNDLRHDIVDIYWNDFDKFATPLMKQKGYPIHSIEVQIYKAALQAKRDGIQTLIFGETADIIYGGHSKLLSREWTKDQFVSRFCFVDPQKVLKFPQWIEEPVLPLVDSKGQVDAFAFLNAFEYDVSLTFYKNACRLAGINFCAPYARTYLSEPLDIIRVRSGESKYIIRELFHKLYPSHVIPDKTPLPRPMTEWLAQWNGPLHDVFLHGCLEELTGDQKWYVYALNEFLLHILE